MSPYTGNLEKSDIIVEDNDADPTDWRVMMFAVSYEFGTELCLSLADRDAVPTSETESGSLSNVAVISDEHFFVSAA